MSNSETPPNDRPTILDFYRDHLAECKLLATISKDPGFLSAIRDEIAEYEAKIARLESQS